MSLTNRTAATLAIQRVERQHRLLEELLAASPRAMAGDELARRLEVSLRTVQRDVTMLQDAGVPIATRRGVTGGYALAAARRRVEVVFTTSEIAAILAALAGIGPTTSGTGRALIERLSGSLAGL